MPPAPSGAHSSFLSSSSPYHFCPFSPSLAKKAASSTLWPLPKPSPWPSLLSSPLLSFPSFFRSASQANFGPNPLTPSIDFSANSITVLSNLSCNIAPVSLPCLSSSWLPPFSLCSKWEQSLCLHSMKEIFSICPPPPQAFPPQRPPAS